MSAPSKILPLLTSREARRTTTERPTNVLSATVPPVCSSAADRADHASPPRPSHLRSRRRFSLFASRKDHGAPTSSYVRPAGIIAAAGVPHVARCGHGVLAARTDDDCAAEVLLHAGHGPHEIPKRQSQRIAVRNPSASPMREPEALHTSPMSPSPEICAPKTFFVLPTPYTLPLKAIAVLSTSFSPLEQS